MRVYFHASVGQKNVYGEYYRRIVEKLKSLGYKVNAKHALDHSWNELIAQDKKDRLNEEYEKSLNRIKNADLVAMEVSYPSSIVVGHLLTRALQLNKPVLGLYHEKATSALLKGYELERFRLSSYSDDNLEDVVEFEINELRQMPDQRFTLLLPGDMVGFLNELAESGINKSEFIRDLIRKEIISRKS